jgi:hypothetical protein
LEEEENVVTTFSTHGCSVVGAIVAHVALEREC